MFSLPTNLSPFLAKKDTWTQTLAFGKSEISRGQPNTPLTYVNGRANGQRSKLVLFNNPIINRFYIVLTANFNI